MTRTRKMKRNIDHLQRSGNLLKRNIINDTLRKGSAILYLFLISIISILAFWAIAAKSGIAFLLFLPVLGVCFWGWTYGRLRFSDKRLRIFWILIQILSTIAMITVAFSLEVDYSWDWGGLIQNASEVVLTGKCDLEYYARYSNNSFWLLCLILVFQLYKFINPNAVLADFKVVSIVLSCLMVQIAILFIYRTAVMIWNEKKGFIVGVIALLFAPFYLYAMFAYTDTSGCLAVSIFLWIHIKTKEEKQNSIGWTVLWGVMASLVLQTKVMGFIVCIAAFLDRFLTSGDFHKWIRYIGILVLSFVVSLMALRFLTGIFVPVTDEMRDQYRFPPVHWIMMGLNEGGGYSEEDVQYTLSFPTYKERCDADKVKIQQRLSDMGVGGTLDLIMRKSKGLWSFGSLGGEFYIRERPLHPDRLLYQIFAFEEKYHHLGVLYMDLFWGCILFGIVLAGWKKETLLSCTGKLCLIGIIIFLAFWESNSRYLFVFSPVLLLLSADGWLMLRERRVRGKRG